jgi:hypothetical protein
MEGLAYLYAQIIAGRSDAESEAVLSVVVREADYKQAAGRTTTIRCLDSFRDGLPQRLLITGSSSQPE